MRPPQHPLHWVDVDLDRLEQNARRVVKSVGDRRVLAVVKADAYGHGAVPAARAFAAGGVHGFAVFRLEEGQELRAGGLREPILLLGTIPFDRTGETLDAGLTPAVHSAESAEALNAEARRRKVRVAYHLKIDTGMGRLGVPENALLAFLKRLARMDGLEMEGIFSHLACAEDLDLPLNAVQRDRFAQAIDAVRAAGHHPSQAHLANSAAVLHDSGGDHDTVRPGLLLYGYSPSPGSPPAEGIHPALAFRARVVQVKTVPSGTTVGYGATWSATRRAHLATIPVGYAEGVRRELQQGGEVLVAGRRAPVVGRISMDLTTVDVSGIEGVSAGDVVTLLGDDGDQRIDAVDWARLTGAIPWEVLCGIPPRVPRRFLRAGEIVGQSP